MDHARRLTADGRAEHEGSSEENPAPMSNPISRKRWFCIHRWMGLVVSLQLLAWSVGGFVFSILDIDDVRGDTNRAAPELRSLEPMERLVSPHVVSLHLAQKAQPITRIELRRRDGKLAYIAYRGGTPIGAVDAETGKELPAVDSEAAERIALADFRRTARVVSSRLITEDPPGEYRGGALPAHQVLLDDEQDTHIYVSAVTGDVTKRRNDLWRTFDFFWMLHIMDYDQRENFNHPLLSGMSVLAILTSLSGLALWWWRIPLRRTGPRSIPSPE